MHQVIATARSFDSKTDDGTKLLVAGGCRVDRLRGEGSALRQVLAQALNGADAVIAGLEEYDAALLSTATRLKVISRYGVGYDKIDFSAAKGRGISFTITPGANGDFVADLAVALMRGAAYSLHAPLHFRESAEAAGWH